MRIFFLNKGLLLRYEKFLPIYQSIYSHHTSVRIDFNGFMQNI